MKTAERFLDGARSARKTAYGYRSQSQSNCSEYWRNKWLNSAQEAEERAEWYESHAQLFNQMEKEK